MLNLIGKMFGSDKAVENGFTLIDKAFYTDQEKAGDKQLANEKKDQLLINWLDASKGANVARRFIATSVTLLWIFFLLFSWGSNQYAIWSGKVTQEKLELMVAANEPYLDQSTGAMMLVLGFYFAAPFMGDIARGAMARFGGKKEQAPDRIG